MKKNIAHRPASPCIIEGAWQWFRIFQEYEYLVLMKCLTIQLPYSTRREVLVLSAGGTMLGKRYTPHAHMRLVCACKHTRCVNFFAAVWGLSPAAAHAIASSSHGHWGRPMTWSSGKGERRATAAQQKGCMFGALLCAAAAWGLVRGLREKCGKPQKS